jgi:hypothetical protein
MIATDSVRTLAIAEKHPLASHDRSTKCADKKHRVVGSWGCRLPGRTPVGFDSVEPGTSISEALEALAAALDCRSLLHDKSTKCAD